ncbi:hypothetical protein TKK_0005629 [Trichogramma kaykai]|uniref:Tetratricopeptide repeat protein n=1 Tax=Trichogramma kaykai TaxID=54128 RepID=A0ABD2XGW5_9HYME
MDFESTKNIECPFTWKLDPKHAIAIGNESMLYDYKSSPVGSFIKVNTLAYIRSMQGNFDDAEKLIDEINYVWDFICKRISKENDYSVDVLLHIKYATAFCVYSMSRKKDQAKAMEIKIKDAKNFNSDIEKGTIFGSQAFASYVFLERNIDAALEAAKLAVSYAPNCELWHYINAQCLRTKRRQQKFDLPVSIEEENEFLKCYELSPSVENIIHVARMYKEKKNWEKSSEMYNQLYLKNPTDFNSNLILALHFIGQNDLIKAKNCLDYFEKNSEHKTKAYYHYLGKYYEKSDNYQKAKENYLKALGDSGNFPADMDHLKLIRKISRSKFDYEEIKHLKNMLKRYEGDKINTVFISLNLAMTYLFKSKNLKLAADYFLKAIKINPCDPQLENFQMTYRDKKYNIFDLISRNILTENENSYGITLKELKNYCTEYNNQAGKNNVPD